MKEIERGLDELKSCYEAIKNPTENQHNRYWDAFGTAIDLRKQYEVASIRLKLSLRDIQEEELWRDK